MQALLWYLLQSSAIVTNEENQGELCIAEICKQGKHRSEIWANFEAAIVSQVGILASKLPVCKFLQGWERCQRKTNSCNLCVADSLFNQRLYKACLDEFWQVALVLESQLVMS